MTLHQEIQQLLSGFSVPEAAANTLAAELEQIERERLSLGLNVGERAPDFELPDSRGRLVRLSERLRRGPVVVSFFRGAWCPVCSLHIAALVRALPAIRAAGGSLLAIYSDSAPLIDDDSPPGLETLRDADQEAIRAYRVQLQIPPAVQQVYVGVFDTDVSLRNSDGSWNLPAPGTFILDQQGIVRRQHVSADFTQRMEPADVVEALEEIRNWPAPSTD